MDKNGNRNKACEFIICDNPIAKETVVCQICFKNYRHEYILCQIGKEKSCIDVEEIL